MGKFIAGVRGEVLGWIWQPKASGFDLAMGRIDKGNPVASMIDDGKARKVTNGSEW